MNIWYTLSRWINDDIDMYIGTTHSASFPDDGGSSMPIELGINVPSCSYSPTSRHIGESAILINRSQYVLNHAPVPEASILTTYQSYRDGLVTEVCFSTVYCHRLTASHECSDWVRHLDRCAHIIRGQSDRSVLNS